MSFDFVNAVKVLPQLKDLLVQWGMPEDKAKNIAFLAIFRVNLTDCYSFDTQELFSTALRKEQQSHAAVSPLCQRRRPRLPKHALRES